MTAAADFDGYTHMGKATLMPNPLGQTLLKCRGFTAHGFAASEGCRVDVHSVEPMTGSIKSITRVRDHSENETRLCRSTLPDQLKVSEEIRQLIRRMKGNQPPLGALHLGRNEH